MTPLDTHARLHVRPCAMAPDAGLSFHLDVQGSPGAMPAAVIWSARVANVALNALNWFWFHKMASRAGAMVFGGKKGSDVHNGKED